MPMSDEHRAALARGRRESRAIKQYLEALGKRRPGRPVTAATLEAKVAALNEKISAETDQLKQVGMIQQRIDAEEALKAASATVDMEALEADFVAHARGYSERKGITYAAWRELGVPAGVLRSAGVPRTRRA